MKVKSENEVAQLCPTLRDPLYCSLPGSSTHEIFQARVLEWGAIALSKTEATEVLKDNIRENLDDLEFSDDFFDKTSKT